MQNTKCTDGLTVMVYLSTLVHNSVLLLCYITRLHLPFGGPVIIDSKFQPILLFYSTGWDRSYAREIYQCAKWNMKTTKEGWNSRQLCHYLRNAFNCGNKWKSNGTKSSKHGTFPKISHWNFFVWQLCKVVKQNWFLWQKSESLGFYGPSRCSVFCNNLEGYRALLVHKLCIQTFTVLCERLFWHETCYMWHRVDYCSHLHLFHPSFVVFIFRSTLRYTSLMWLVPRLATYEWIRSMHLSESVTIAVFRKEPAWWKGECLFNVCRMNVMIILDLFPFLSVITLRIPISSVALRSDTSAAHFKY